MKKLLLISNSMQHGQGYLDHCADDMVDMLADKNEVVFVPFALADHAWYAKVAGERFAQFGKKLTSLHSVDDKSALVKRSEAIFIGGGNTFRLLTDLYKYDLLGIIRERVLSGAMTYMGASAGSNMACPTIKTTNDMPIVYPPSFDALNLVDFQINPHYLDPDPHSKHQGETREQRIKEFHEMNDTPVVGLREGAYIRVEGDIISLRGTTGARLFVKGKEGRECEAGEDLNSLL